MYVSGQSYGLLLMFTYPNQLLVQSLTTGKCQKRALTIKIDAVQPYKHYDTS